MTPMRPFRVAPQAACTEGSSTPVKGISVTGDLVPRMVLTVPQAAMIILMGNFRKNAISSFAYFNTVSRLRLP